MRDVVRLVPMTESEFKVYRERAVKNYAQEHVRAGNLHPSEALQRAEADFQKLLPDGVASKNQRLFSVKDRAGVSVGMIWFAVRDAPRPAAFIYDFVISEPHRKKGYGKSALDALEAEVRELGLTAISLHVFAHNRAAITLYEKVGYETTDLHMTKRVVV